MKTFSLIVIIIGGISYFGNKIVATFNAHEYKKGYSDAIKSFQPQMDSIRALLDSNYILTPKDYRKLVATKIKNIHP